MKKLIFLLTTMLCCMAMEAKVVKVTLTDGSTQVLTTSELEAIDFEDGGAVVMTTYKGETYRAGKESAAALLDELTIDDEEAVYEEFDRTVTFTYHDKDFFSRGMHQINFVYPSQDPFGEPISLSGAIFIPQNIWEGHAESNGVLLFNHYTIFDANEAPTRGYFRLEGMFMANPLNLNYIVVESDFYGFGATERFPQAYMQGTVNARASLDALLAARRLLESMEIDYGSLTFNVGYSSGGFDALATQKLRDMEYKDEVSFDKTFAGGSPSDLRECYRQYVEIDSTAYNAVPALLMVSVNETQGMGLSYEDLFQPFLAEKIDEWVMSKKHWSWAVCDSIGREKKIHEILSQKYCDLRSSESRELQSLFYSLSITKDWIPDPSQRIYLFHSRGDDYVPVQAARPVISYLKNYGFTPSIIPGRTNLQTNILVRNKGHLEATLFYLAQTLAALKAWPMMYADGELKPLYEQIAKHDVTSPVQMMRYLDSMGIDCRAILTKLIEKLMESKGSDGEEIDIKDGLNYFVVMAKLNEVCQQMGLTLDELMEMMSDSGIDFMSLVMDFILYLTEDTASSKAALTRSLQSVELQKTPADQYEQSFTAWMTEKGITE